MLLFSGLKTCTPTHIRRHFACTHKNHLVTHLHRWEKHALKHTWTNLHAIDKEEREHFWNGRYSHYYLSLLSVAAATLKTRSKLEMQKLTLSPSGQAGLKHENEFLKIIYSNKNPTRTASGHHSLRYPNAPDLLHNSWFWLWLFVKLFASQSMFQPRWALYTADAQEPLGQVAFFSLLSAELLKAKMNVISSVVALLRLRSVSLKRVDLRRVRRMRSDCRLMSASYPLQFISFLFLFSLLSFPLSSLMSDMKWKKISFWI